MKNMALWSTASYFVLFSFLFTRGAFDGINGYESVKNSHPDASLEVRPNTTQLVEGKPFTLFCSVHGGNSTGWVLKRRQGATIDSGCLQLNGTESGDRPGECHFTGNDSHSGLYWCESPAENKTSNVININININSNSTDVSEEKSSGSLVWLSGICIVLILVVILPLLWLLFPGFREKLFACRNGAYRRERVQQEMPQTKQDVTEIQWDLPWMEMDNLLGKQQKPVK